MEISRCESATNTIIGEAAYISESIGDASEFIVSIVRVVRCIVCIVIVLYDGDEIFVGISCNIFLYPTKIGGGCRPSIVSILKCTKDIGDCCGTTQGIMCVVCMEGCICCSCRFTRARRTVGKCFTGDNSEIIVGNITCCIGTVFFFVSFLDWSTKSIEVLVGIGGIGRREVVFFEDTICSCCICIGKSDGSDRIVGGSVTRDFDFFDTPKSIVKCFGGEIIGIGDGFWFS
mgnify:CR=1 FL=1